MCKGGKKKIEEEGERGEIGQRIVHDFTEILLFGILFLTN